MKWEVSGEISKRFQKEHDSGGTEVDLHRRVSAFSGSNLITGGWTDWIPLILAILEVIDAFFSEEQSLRVNERAASTRSLLLELKKGLNTVLTEMERIEDDQ